MADKIVPQKKCVKCGMEKPATREHFSPRKGNTDGLEYRCKSCEALRRRESRKEHPERHKASQKKDRDSNHEWWLERTQKWRDDNPKKVEEYRAWYYEENAEICRLYSREYYHKNRDICRAKHKKWCQDNPEKDRVRHHRRRIRLLSVGGNFNTNDIKLQLKTQNGKCWWCGKKLNDKYHIDHRIPLAKGGTNWPENIVISCPKCNLSKGAKMPHEFNGRLL